MKRNKLMSMAIPLCGLLMAGLVGCQSAQQEDPSVRATHPRENPYNVKDGERYDSYADRDGQATRSGTRTADGMVTATAAFPTGDADTSALLLEKVAPASVQLNQTFNYEIDVTNLTSNTLTDVTVIEEVPDNVEITGSSPQATMSGGELRWNLGRLGPNESETIRIEATPTAVADITNCARATYAMLACVTTSVTQPQLALSKSVSADQVLICEPITYTMTVQNTGSGVARNVMVRDPLPAGLTTTEGANELSYNVGDLGPGASKTITAQVKANRTGEFANTAVATADGNLRSEAEASVVVQQPVLTVEKSGPDNAFLAKNVTYSLSVSNTGDGVARETVVRDTLPANTTLVSASQGGRAANGVVTWNVGTLNPGQSREFEVTVKPTAKGQITNSVVASAYCADSADAETTTNVTGIAAILLEVVDENDPVQVGQNEVYTITVTNQGSAEDKTIRLRATLEDEMEYVGVTGPTQANLQGQNVVFQPLDTLGPGDTATWKLTVRAAEATPQRTQLRVEMNSSEMERSVFETEATNFYD